MSPLDPQLVRLGWDAEFAALLPDGLRPGRVSRLDRGLATVETAQGPLRAAFGRDLVAVGDWVGLGDDPPDIAAVLDRRTAVVREAAGGATVEQVLAANVDTVFITVSLETAPNARRLERTLALAWSSGATPVVVLTKADRCPDLGAALGAVEASAVGVEVVVTSSVTGLGLDALSPWVGLRADGGAPTVVVLGASGAGKSTLVNALAGQEVMAIQSVRGADAKGRHTTVHRQLVVLPSGALLLDTPGLRGLGLWGSSDGVDAAFADLEELAEQCRFGDCAHAGEPGCAVGDAIAAGTLTPERLASWQKLRNELAHLAARRDKRLAAEQRRDRVRMMKSYRDVTRDRRER